MAPTDPIDNTTAPFSFEYRTAASAVYFLAKGRLLRLGFDMFPSAFQQFPNSLEGFM